MINMATDISLHDTTFIIPIRIDSLIRLENLLAVVHYLKAIQCNIIIIESLTSNINVTKKMTEWPMGYTLVHREQMSKQGYHKNP